MRTFSLTCAALAAALTIGAVGKISTARADIYEDISRGDSFPVAQLLPPRRPDSAPRVTTPDDQQEAAPAPRRNAPAGGTVIETDATSVRSDTKISVGSWLGDIVSALWAAIGATVAAAAVRFLLGFAGPMGAAVTDAQRQRLNDMVQNGIALALTKARVGLDGKIPLDVHSAIAKDVLEYVRLHGGDTLGKLLGKKGWFGTKAPTEQEIASSEETIEARVARFIQAHNKQVEFAETKPQPLAVLESTQESSPKAMPGGEGEPLFQPENHEGIRALVRESVAEALKQKQRRRA